MSLKEEDEMGLLEAIRPVVTPDGIFYSQVLQAVIKIERIVN